jgi:hypothetical protein
MKYILFSFAVLLALGIGASGQNYRYDSPFPSISASSPPFLVANVPPNSPTLSVCHSPANQVPCTNYATTYTSSSVACSNGAQDTPQPQPSACQSTGDAQGNIGFWAPAGTYDYTVCISNNCFGPYTITIGGGGGGGGGSPNQGVSFVNQTSVTLPMPSNTVYDIPYCYDNSNPANAISPNTITLNPSTYVFTFTFFNPQSGYCVGNSSGGAGTGVILETNGVANLSQSLLNLVGSGVTNTSGGNVTITSGSGGGGNPILENCTPDQTGNSFPQVTSLTNWFNSHWEFVYNTTTYIDCEVYIPAAQTGATLVVDVFSADSTAGHTANIQTCDAIVNTGSLNVGALTCASAQTFTTNSTAYGRVTLTFNVQSTLVNGGILAVKIGTSPTGTAPTSDLILYPHFVL